METKSPAPGLVSNSEDKPTPAELRRASHTPTECLDQVEAEITALRDGLAGSAASLGRGCRRP